jgi:hypothetical protein
LDPHWFGSLDPDPGGLKTSGSGSPTLLTANSTGTIFMRMLFIPFLKTTFRNDKNDACSVVYSDYDIFLENDEGSRVYGCKKLF